MKPFNSKSQGLKNKLMNDCAKKPADKNFCECIHTESDRREILEHCRKFNQDDTRNPKTKRKIKKDSKTYKKLKFQCNLCMNEIDVQRLSRQSSGTSSESGRGFSPDFPYAESPRSQERINTIDELQETIRNLNNRISELNNSERTLLLELESKNVEINEIKLEIENIRQLFEKCKEERINDVELIEKLKNDYYELNEEKKQIENEKKVIEKKFKEQIDEKNKLIENLKLQIQDKDNTINSIENRLKRECDEQLQTITIQLSNKEREINKLLKRIRDLEETEDIGYDYDYEKEYDLSSEYQILIGDYEELEKKYEEIEKEYNKKILEFEELNLLSQKSLEVIKSKNEEISNLDRKYKNCLQNIKDSEDETKKKISEWDQKAKNEKLNNQKVIDDKNRTIKNLQKKLEEESDKNKNIKTAYEKFLDQAELIESQNNRIFNQKMQELQNEIKQKSLRIQELQQENDELLNINEQLKVPYEENIIDQESFLKYTEKLEEYEKEKQKLEFEYAQNLEEYENQIRELESVNIELRNEILLLADKNDITMEEYNEYKNILFNIIEKLNDLGFTLRDFGIEIETIQDINDILSILDIINYELKEFNNIEESTVQPFNNIEESNVQPFSNIENTERVSSSGRKIKRPVRLIEEIE